MILVKTGKLGFYFASASVKLVGPHVLIGSSPDVNVGKALLAEEENGLLELVLESPGLDLFEGFPVDMKKSLAALAVGDSSGGLLATEGLNGLDGFLSVSHLLTKTERACLHVRFYGAF
jgi:hypothetical protein